MLAGAVAFRQHACEGCQARVRKPPSGVQRSWGTLHQAFNLIFSGPPGDVLREGLYTFQVERGPEFEFYVMPIHTPAPGQQDYQAAFN
jgi:Domain of unknown function (DUF6916)